MVGRVQKAIVLLVLVLAAGPAAGGTARPLDSLAARLQETGARAFAGREGWLFFTPEIRHLAAGEFWGPAAVSVSRATRPEAADPLPAILAFHSALEARGIHLLMVPVPAKARIYPEYLPEPMRTSDVAGVHERFYAKLRSKGIAVLDPTERLRAGREHHKGPVYCRQDSHWSGIACVLVAEKIAAAIREHLVPPAALLEMEAAWEKIALDGDLARLLPEPPAEREELNVRKIRSPRDGALLPVEPDPHSPVVLLGDSHALVFHAGGDMHARGAGLADQLACELGFAVDLVAVRGSGATPARLNLFRRAQRDADYWEQKRVVVWCFSVREFTESDGWRVLPIEP